MSCILKPTKRFSPSARSGRFFNFLQPRGDLGVWASTITMEYKLFFRDIMLGTVKGTNADFPGISGTFHPCEMKGNAQIIGHLSDYIKTSIELDDLMLKDESAYKMCVTQKETPFVDLFETDDWKMTKPDGTIDWIMVPVFGADKSITWRYNFNKK